MKLRLWPRRVRIRAALSQRANHVRAVPAGAGEQSGAPGGQTSLRSRWLSRRLLRWANLTPKQRRRLLSRLGEDLPSIVSDLAGSRMPQRRRIVAHIARTTPIPRAITCLARLREDPDLSVGLEARHALRALVDSAQMLRVQQREALVDALATSLRTDDPDDRRELASLFERVALDAPVALARFQASADDADQMALRRAIRTAGDGAASMRAVRWLQWAVAAPTAADSIRRRFDNSMLPAAHLLRAPSRRALLERRRAQSSPVPAPDDLHGVDVEQLPHAVRWRSAVSAGSRQRVREGRAALSAPGAAHRILVAHALDPRDSDENRLLTDLAFDPDHRVARLAALRCDRCSPAVTSAWERLVRSPSGGCASLAAVAERDRRRLQLRDLRARVADEPDYILAEIRGAMHAGDAARRLQAITLALRLSLERHLVDDLLRAVQDEDRRVVATAVRALGRVDATSARAALAACLGHADARVRANALEALARREPDTTSLESAVFDDVARIRANAVRALLLRRRNDETIDRLEAMLGDDRPAHRLSGLWVAERLATPQVAETVAHLAGQEVDPIVRRRAKRCARRLLAELRQSTPTVTISGRVSETATV